MLGFLVGSNTHCPYRYDGFGVGGCAPEGLECGYLRAGCRSPRRAQRVLRQDCAVREDDGEDVKEEAVSVEEEANGVENGLSGRIGSEIAEEANGNLPHASELT